LLDEPISSIDSGSKEVIKKNLRSILKKFKVATLIITHDLNDGWSLASRIFIT